MQSRPRYQCVHIHSLLSSSSAKRNERVLLWRLLGLIFWVHLSGEPIGRRTGTSRGRIDLSTQAKQKGSGKENGNSKGECGMTRPVIPWGRSLGRTGIEFDEAEAGNIPEEASMRLELLRQKERE